MSAAWIIRAAQPADAEAWRALRSALWPGQDSDVMAAETRAYFESGEKMIALLSVDAAGGVVGFAEGSLRSDYVNGTDTSPVGFLEGLYVEPTWRRRGLGRALVAGVEEWVRAAGCSELASDTEIANVASHAAHRAFGFAETERVVYFRKCV